MFLLIELTKVLQRDEKAQENAPKVFQDEASPSKPKGARAYSTTARRPAQVKAMSNSVSSGSQPPGHIFGLPELPLPSTAHIKHRYDPVIKQVTNLLMQDGKLSVAQRVRPSVPLFLTYNPLLAHTYIEISITDYVCVEHGYDTRAFTHSAAPDSRPQTSFNPRRSSHNTSSFESYNLSYSCN